MRGERCHSGSFLLVVTLAIAWPLNGQFTRHVNKVGTTSASFLEMGAGARAVAMGEAFVAVADDATALYWNPAGISTITQPRVHFYHSPWIADIQYDYVSAVVPLGRAGVIGLSGTSVTMDEMDVRTVFYPEGTGERFGANSVSLGASYGRSLTESFSFGLNVKAIQEQIWHMSATAVAFDIGSLFITRNRGIRIGMSVSNFGEKMRLTGRDTQVKYDIDEEKTGNNDRIDAYLDTWAWPLPLLFRVGIATNLMETSLGRITVSMDAVHPNDNVEYVNAGVEYVWNETLSLRAGRSTLFMDSAEQEWSLGIGIRQTLFQKVDLNLDYVSRSFGVFDLVSGYSLNLAF